MSNVLPYSKTDIELTNRDIQFECEHCANILIVDKDGEGIELNCPHCGGVVTVPPYEDSLKYRFQSAGTNAEMARIMEEPLPEFDFSDKTKEFVESRMSALESKLKENNSQRMETQGHINRLTIELHRHNLTIARLQRKKLEYEAELKALKAAEVPA